MYSHITEVIEERSISCEALFRGDRSCHHTGRYRCIDDRGRSWWLCGVHYRQAQRTACTVRTWMGRYVWARLKHRRVA